MQKQFTKINSGLLVRAPGKINLSLLVKGKRADGYHDIESIMAKIDWYDEIFIDLLDENFKNQKSKIKNQNYGSPAASQESSFSGTGKPEIELICKGEYKVPEGEENLVYKAAKLILEEVRDDGRWTRDEIPNPKIEIPNKLQLTKFQIPNSEPSFAKATEGRHRTQKAECRREGIRLTLTKNMPAGSGLGSGSSDAAATLMGVNKFLKLGLSKGKLSELAAKLGSDVAFFLDGPMALCTGRGEKIKKLERCEFRVFLVVPDVSVSTKRVYGNYRHDAARFKQLHKQISEYIVKKRIDLICSLCANMLQESCFELHPDLEELKKKIESLGIRPVSLSGSGSAMFCVINKDNEEGVRRYKDRLEREYGCIGIIININS